MVSVDAMSTKMLHCQPDFPGPEPVNRSPHVQCMHVGVIIIGVILIMQVSNVAEATIHDQAQPYRFEQRKGALLDALSCGVDKSKKGRSASTFKG